jgi:cell division protein ZapA (FtsZ GTPase activity inhibitor)
VDRLLTIDVLGQPLTIKTDSDESEARAVADYVSKSIEQVKLQCANQVPSPDKGAILILAALNIASEYFDLKKNHQQMLDDINQRSVHLLNALETQVNAFAES